LIFIFMENLKQKTMNNLFLFLSFFFFIGSINAQTAPIKKKNYVDEQKILNVEAATPRAGYISAPYRKADGNWYEKTDAGVEQLIIDTVAMLATKYDLQNVSVDTLNEIATKYDLSNISVDTLDEIATKYDLQNVSVDTINEIATKYDITGITLDDTYNNFKATASKIVIDGLESQTGGLVFDMRNSNKFNITTEGVSFPTFSTYLKRTGFGTNTASEGKVNIHNEVGDNIRALYILQNATEPGSRGIDVLSYSENEPPAYFDMKDSGGKSRATTQLSHWESGLGTNWLYRDTTATVTKSPVVFIEQDHALDDQPALKIQQDGTGNYIESNVFNVEDDGRIKLNSYNGTGFTGTAVKFLAVDASGYLIEEDEPSGGGGTVDTINEIATKYDLIGFGDGDVTGSGTFNQIAFFDNTKNIISESDLYYNSTTNRLGINNGNSAAFNLDVNGDGRFVTSNENMLTLEGTNKFPTLKISTTGTQVGRHAAISFRDGTTQKAVIAMDADDSVLSFGVTSVNNDYMTLNSSGNVGIKTKAQTQPLDVNGNARFRNSIYDSNNEAGTSGQILSSTVTGTDWIEAQDPAAGMDAVVANRSYVDNTAALVDLSSGQVYYNTTSNAFVVLP
jgi:hypothetical protein